jgi:hypothetical protein
MAESPEAFYYADAERNRQGPFTDAEIVRLIRDGTIGPDTLIWSAGLTDWRAAGQVGLFASLFARAPAPATASAPTGRLAADFPVWGLFWRTLVAGFGNVLVVPAPWTGTMFYRFMATHTALPDGRRFTFAGQPGDIWLVFVGIGLLSLVGACVAPAAVITVPVTAALSVALFRWFCGKLGTKDGPLNLRFTGGVWPYIGWVVLLYLSFITIIGWAWVLRFMMRWICQNIAGTIGFDFHASGWAILWRTLAFSLGAIFIIPIPWLLRWFAAWFVSEIEATDRRGPS